MCHSISGRFKRKRVVLQGSAILLVEGVKPRFVQALNLGKLARQVVAKLRLKRTPAERYPGAVTSHIAKDPSQARPASARARQAARRT